MQNLVVLMEPSEHASNISSKTGMMILNRFCIDEDAAFELSEVHHLKYFYYNPEKGKEYSGNRIHTYSKFHFHEKWIIPQNRTF